MSCKIKAICRKFTLVASFVLVCLIGKSQYNFTGVGKILLENQKSLGNNFVALVYKDGKIIYQKETEEFKARTRAPLGNCSKWLTAALVMTFVDEGKISLDDRVGMYLPIFETYGRSDITIRQCLSHQTGIADNEKGVVKLMEMQRLKFETLEDEVNSFAKKEVAAKPGVVFNYGNMGLNIAGRVLEAVSKKKFDVLAKQRIFTPLNMRSSSFTPEERSINPSTGAFSTAVDYMNFLTMMLDKGVFMGKRILSEAAVKEMETIQTKDIPKKYIPKAAIGYEYGLGEWIEASDSNGNSTVVSCSGLPGTIAFVDKCRNYACVIFIKDPDDELKKDVYTELKKEIDKQIAASCN
ncbi:MAG: beta-lactamase family protein [Ferruginibacter sp.]|nr:beta-lactamase family protein [Ferruginibacter sp.]